MAGSFATESFQGEKQEVLAVHMSLSAKTLSKQCLPSWLMCTDIVQPASAALFPLFPSSLFPNTLWIALIVRTTN